MKFPRRTRVPDAVRAITLTERRLAWAMSADGTALVATQSALWVGSEPLPWTQVEKVRFTPPVLMIREVADVEGAGTERQFELAQDHRLAETVRSAVTSSVAWTDVRRLEPAGRVRVVGRRVPGQDALLWQVVWLDGTDPQDPALLAQAQAAVAALRATIG